MGHKKLASTGFTLIEMVVVIIVIALLSAFVVPKYVTLKADAATAKGEGIFAAVQDGVGIYHSACQVRGGNDASLNGSFNIDGVRSSWSGSCFPAVESTRRIKDSKQCFEMLNAQLGSDKVESKQYGWSRSQGSSNSKNVSLSYLEASKEADYPIFIQQARTYFAYCHFYFIDGTDWSKTPYLLFDGDTGRLTSGVADLNNGLDWDKSLTLY